MGQTEFDGIAFELKSEILKIYIQPFIGESISTINRNAAFEKLKWNIEKSLKIQNQHHFDLYISTSMLHLCLTSIVNEIMLVSGIEREKRPSIFLLHWKLEWFPFARVTVKIEVFHHGKEHSNLKRKLIPLFIRNWSHCCVLMEQKPQNTLLFWNEKKNNFPLRTQSHAGVDKNPFDCIITMWNKLNKGCMSRTLIALLHIHQHFLIDNNERHKNSRTLYWMAWIRAQQQFICKKGVNKQHLFSSRGKQTRYNNSNKSSNSNITDSLTHNKLDRFGWNWNWKKKSWMNACTHIKHKTKKRKEKADTTRQSNEVNGARSNEMPQLCLNCWVFFHERKTTSQFWVLLLFYFFFFLLSRHRVITIPTLQQSPRNCTEIHYNSFVILNRYFFLKNNGNQ